MAMLKASREGNACIGAGASKQSNGDKIINVKTAKVEEPQKAYMANKGEKVDQTSTDRTYSQSDDCDSRQRTALALVPEPNVSASQVCSATS